MVQDDGPVGLDGVRVEFDDERVVSDAGLMLLATLGARLGIEELARRRSLVSRRHNSATPATPNGIARSASPF